jgi:hypothetical protein
MKEMHCISLGVLVVLLVGCNSTKAPKKIYQWDGYQDSIYQYYQKDTSPQDQIATLQKLVEKSRASSLPVPPGLHAQLGLLFSNTGKMDSAIAEFNTEKKLFPESTAYIDFLTSKDKGSLK